MRALLLAIAVCTQLTIPALACGPVAAPGASGSTRHPLGAALDELLPRASLSAPDREQVLALRERIRQLDAGGDTKGARQVEEQAMRLLGYRKVWLRCGPGTFSWVKDTRPPGQPGS